MRRSPRQPPRMTPTIATSDAMIVRRMVAPFWRCATPMTRHSRPNCAASNATAAAGAQCEASAGASISDENPMHVLPKTTCDLRGDTLADAGRDNRRSGRQIAARKSQRGGVGDVRGFGLRRTTRRDAPTPEARPRPLRVRSSAPDARARPRRSSRGRRRSTFCPRPSGKAPRMRWTSALLAKYSFISGVQAPRNGARDANAMTKLRVIPV